MFEDDLLHVFLAPAALGGMEGHTLVTTQRHAPTLLDLTEQESAALGLTLAHAARAVYAAFNPDGILVQQHNGVAAFQTVPHIHVHVIPMRDGATFPPERQVPITPPDERARLARELQSHWPSVP